MIFSLRFAFPGGLAPVPTTYDLSLALGECQSCHRANRPSIAADTVLVHGVLHITIHFQAAQRGGQSLAPLDVRAVFGGAGDGR